MKAVSESTIARQAASACIDRCTRKAPRKAADYPHDVVYVVFVHYRGGYTGKMAFHADDATVAREYAKCLRRYHRLAEDGARVAFRAVDVDEYCKA